ncbi:MAG: histidine--tRNA ligase, partial [Nitrospinaceae bacterium]
YIGPMFRYERPQAGRFRQFYQIGVEAMGSHNPAIDAEVMIMLMDFFHTLGLKGLKLQINSLGCCECRPTYREILKKAIHSQLSCLCENCNQRYQRNPMRILDCKVKSCQEIAVNLPKTTDNLCNECDDHFKEVQSLLNTTKVSYDLDFMLVRGLDYYTHTAFEVTSSQLGAQNAICGGGRYNTLVEEFEGPATPCFGFALGLERLISIVPFSNPNDYEKKPDIYIIYLGAELKVKAFNLAHHLRTESLSVEIDYDGGSIKSQMRKADKSASRYALIFGENEIKSGNYQLKDMKNGKQIIISANSCVEEILKLLNSEA